MRISITKSIMCFLVLAILSSISSTVIAQKALPTGTKLVAAINGDTTSAGVRINKSYTLERGGIYFVTGQIANNYDLKISATGNTTLDRPKLIIVPDASGNTADYIFKPYKSLKLDGLYISGVNSSRNQQGNLIQTGTTNVKITLNNCEIDSVKNRIIVADQNFCSVFITDSYMHNTANSSHGGRIIDARETIMDTIVMVNNTFYNVMHNILGRFSGGQKYFKFDHNTVYNLMRTPLRIDVCPDIVMTNNLFLQTGFVGYIPEWEKQFQLGDMGDRDEWTRIEIWPLDSLNAFKGMTQKINCKNNNFWIDPAIETAFPDTIYKYRTLDFAFEKKMVGADTLTWVSENVSFVKAPSCKYLEMAKECWKDGSPQTNPGFDNTGYPFNFSYSTTSKSYTAATGGFPLGDLNWFPEQKAKWLTSSDVIETDAVIPVKYSLEQNYPNPFNPTTSIRFEIPTHGNYTVKVANILGQEVATLINGKLNAGVHHVTFNAANLSSGVYFYSLTGDKVNITKKMLLMK
ncbi:MAG: T9SS type A sorting domain-containing protein [Melioribacteraceae bacterium]